MATLSRKIALSIFGLLVVGAPLLFGAVDRNFQIALTALLGVGLLFVKPSFPRLKQTTSRIVVGLAAILFVMQFAPAFCFSETQWHKVLTGNFGVAFPFTHHPEPARALDAMLMMAIATIWFFWVRTLADDRNQRVALAWTLFGSTAVLAVVSLSIGNATTNLIYGYRSTPGWAGFGPFPNRNHTACFLAMGVPIGIGCLVRAARRKLFLQLFGGHICLGLIIVALIDSKSRGGLVALAVGLCVYSGLALIRSRSHKVVAVILAGAFVASALLLAFGSKVLGRFASESDGAISTQTRIEIWHDAVNMWKDAPLFGHGISTFAGLFPIYQTLKLDNQVVLHPESSWLQWLVELGLIPVVIATLVLLVFLAKNLAEMLARKNGFFLRASGVSAVVILLSHSAWDVPAHRWATAAYGLAALALASPFRSREPLVNVDRRVAFVPLSVACFWLLPFVMDGPAWSPARLDRLMASNAAAPAQVRLSELEHVLHYFPLDPELHEAVGLRQLPYPYLVQSAWQHFRLADRLEPSSWGLPATQAKASRRFSEGMSLHFWTVAIERAGAHSDELFQTAYRNTSDLPVAESFWGRYVESNPQLLLSYAKCIPDADAGYYFSLWWKNRALTGPLEQAEVDAFYRFAGRWGTRANFGEWMKRYPNWEERDFKSWASLLHEWKDDAAAWEILSRWIKEPETPQPHVSTSVQVLEAQWRADPSDTLNAQALAAACIREDKKEKSEKVILAVAETDRSPRWFLRKAAYIYAANGEFAKAVDAMIRGS